MKRLLLIITFVLIAVSAFAFDFGLNLNFGGGKWKCTDLVQNTGVSPTEYAFANQSTGTTADAIFTYSNTGTAQLSAAELAVSGTSFTLQSTTCGENPFDLAASASCTATVRFAPLTAAAFTGSLDLTAPNFAGLSASLTGTGVSYGDSTPDAFTFTDQTDVALSSTITSAPITVAGIDTASAISVTGGTYDINASDSFTSSPGTVNNGDAVRARHTSSGANSTAVNTVVTIGGVSDTFTSTTVAAAEPGFVGDNSAGSYDAGASAINQGVRGVYAATTTGSVNVICADLNFTGTTTHWNAAIYSSDGNTLLGDGSLTVSPADSGVRCISLDSPVSITQGTSYMLAFGSSDDSSWQSARKAFGAGTRFVAVPMTVGDAMPATMSGGSQNTNYTTIMYATYQ